MKCTGYFTDCNGKKSFGRLLAFMCLLIGMGLLICSGVGYFLRIPGWDAFLGNAVLVIIVSTGGKVGQTVLEKFGFVQNNEMDHSEKDVGK